MEPLDVAVAKTMDDNARRLEALPSRRLHHKGRYYIVLTVAELFCLRQSEPHRIRVIGEDFCVEE